ncbi:hypothetical protein QQP08_010184 [Theobroma cacao]|nr:hypothetical protein QQP08_010184 [Theobroma cacao]
MDGGGSLVGLPEIIKVGFLLLFCNDDGTHALIVSFRVTFTRSPDGISHVKGGKFREGMYSGLVTCRKTRLLSDHGAWSLLFLSFPIECCMNLNCGEC